MAKCSKGSAGEIRGESNDIYGFSNRLPGDIRGKSNGNTRP
jgi:hypothetical protein